MATNKPTAEQLENAVIAAALTRAANSLDTGGAAPAPGAHTVSVTVDIEGDVVVNPDTTAVRCGVNPLTALACYAIDSGEAIEDWAVEGVRLIRRQKRSKAGRERLKEAVDRIKNKFADEAEKAGFYSEFERKGAVGGEPVATVTAGGVLV